MRGLQLQVFYSVRSERILMEQMRYNLLFRWFMGLSMDDTVWDHSMFSKNRDRGFDHAVVEASVDGTLTQAWAGHKSFVAKDGSDDQLPQRSGRNRLAKWKGKLRSNDTHALTTDPDTWLYKKSDNTPPWWEYLVHILIENWSLFPQSVLSHTAKHMQTNYFSNSVADKHQL